jgi:hypothetical protein
MSSSLLTTQVFTFSASSSVKCIAADGNQQPQDNYLTGVLSERIEAQRHWVGRVGV